MITRLQVKGFKSFQDVDISLRAFQVLVGQNGVGKSNLFDVIVLLSHLARGDSLREAFSNIRGEPLELFTLQATGEPGTEIQIGVELLVARGVRDQFGEEADVSSTRLRYELTIERRQDRAGFERLYIRHEALTAISEDADIWSRQITPVKIRKRWIVRERRSPYISTDGDRINKHQDRRSGNKQEIPLGNVERTILSSIASTEYPTAYAARQEMLNWKYLQFDPLALRQPNNVQDDAVLGSDGAHLAAVLWRMAQQDDEVLIDVSRDMLNLVRGVRSIDVRLLPERKEFVIEAHWLDGRVFTSRVLSDGTLRLLALVTLRNDPQHQGVICLEEPENGVHAERLEEVVKILRALSTDFTEVSDTETAQPKQVILNTHSPKVAAHIDLEDLLFVYMTNREPRETRFAPVVKDLKDKQPHDGGQYRYTLAEITRYLDSSLLSKQQKRLRELG